jgi:superfamily II DNA or RNA helicase
VIATQHTAATDTYLSRVANGSHLLLVVDEVHRIGAASLSRSLSIDAGGRLGLSATPERYGDPEGTAMLRKYFGEDLLPVINLTDAIAIGRLCPYEYHPHAVSLNHDETEEWVALTKEIGRVLAGRGPEDLTASHKLLLIRRARIAKKAQEKVTRAREIVTTNYQRGDLWLVYCEDQFQLSAVRAELRAHGVSSLEYHTSMSSDAETTMASFQEYGGVLCAIRCLDEGVDIPAVTHALILASSQNPRQYIQRRGRVLRIAPGKTRAVVHDAIVTPPLIDGRSYFDRLVIAELARAWEFASSAVNKGAALAVEALATDYGVDLQELVALGDEAEGEVDRAEGEVEE